MPENLEMFVKNLVKYQLEGTFFLSDPSVALTFESPNAKDRLFPYLPSRLLIWRTPIRKIWVGLTYVLQD